jgi:hypothetical protein
MFATTGLTAPAGFLLPAAAVCANAPVVSAPGADTRA